MRLDEFIPPLPSIPAGAIVLFETDPDNPALRAYRRGDATLFESAASAAAAYAAIAAAIALKADAGDVTASGLTQTNARMLGRTAGGTGAVEELDAAAVKSFLSLTNMGQTQFGRGTGTGYVLTASQAEVVFGTGQAVVTLDRSGTWLLFPTIQFQTQAATFAATRTVTVNVRRTNNTAANLGQAGFRIVPVMTTLTSTQPCLLQPQVYTTANTDDRIALFADINVLPTAGTIEAVRACILAVLVAPTNF